MKRRNQAGFTLVEIMIVVAIIALLAAIAIPNLLRARISGNDALAQSTLRAMSTSAESYGTSNNGNYPVNMGSLTGPLPAVGPAYLNKDYCAAGANRHAGYDYTCTMTAAAYTFVAAPVTGGTTGSSTYTIIQGGVLTGVAAP